MATEMCIPMERLDAWSRYHVLTSELSECLSWWLFRGQTKIWAYAQVPLRSVHFIPFLSGWFKGREDLWAGIIPLLPDRQHLPQQSPITDMGSASCHRSTRVSPLFPAPEGSTMEAGWTVRLEEDEKLVCFMMQTVTANPQN